MDDALLVGRLETGADLQGHRVGFLPLEGLLRVDEMAQVLPRHQGHGEELQVPVLAVVVEGHHVLVPHPAGELDLLHEAAARLGIPPGLLQDLEGHPLAQLPVLGLVNEAHAPHAQQPDDLVATGDDISRLEGR